MTDLNALRSPLSFLQSELEDIPHRDVLDAEEGWWKGEGIAISDTIDRAGTPWLRMFDRLGKRADEILYPREYQTILKRGYRSGVVWRALEEKSLIPTYLLIYNISFHDPGICCPYTVSLGTAVPACEIWQRRIAGSVSAPTFAEGRFRVAGRHVDDGDQRRFGFGSRVSRPLPGPRAIAGC